MVYIVDFGSGLEHIKQISCRNIVLRNAGYTNDKPTKIINLADINEILQK